MLRDDSISLQQNQHLANMHNNSVLLPDEDKKRKRNDDEDSLPVTKKCNIDIVSFQRNIQALLDSSKKLKQEEEQELQPKYIGQIVENIVNMYTDIEVVKQQTRLSVVKNRKPYFMLLEQGDKDREITTLKRKNIEQADQISSMHRLVLKLSRDTVVKKYSTKALSYVLIDRSIRNSESE